jgi:Peptidase_C39 like family
MFCGLWSIAEVAVYLPPLAEAVHAPTLRDITFRAWRGGELARGEVDGVVVGPEGIAIGEPTRTMSGPDGATDDAATWTSPVVDPGHAVTGLVPSWNATTPPGTWVEVRVQVGFEDGSVDSFVLGRWASDNPPTGAIGRTSVAGQETEYATVDTDTLVARNEHTIRTWQLLVTLLRPAGTAATPTVRFVGAMTSRLQTEQRVLTSQLGLASKAAVDLAVPTYSQEVHRGHYPEFDGGGEAWCSPASTAMVLSYWGVGPSAEDLAAISPPVDPMVDVAAQHVYDDGSGGCGNWSFNTAYAAGFGVEGFVTRLRSLQEAELFLAAGIPLVASVSFTDGELTGAGYGTDGHLLVVRGFTTSGDVIVNDPASHLSADDGRVRVVYDREEFENVWVPRSGGIVYVLRPPGWPLPAAPAQANW